jgi:hypothetical protein
MLENERVPVYGALDKDEPCNVGDLPEPPGSGHHPSNLRGGWTNKCKSTTLKAERKAKRNRTKKARRINRR